MRKEKIKVLWIGDAVTPTGFSRVNHSIISNLPQNFYAIDFLGINYFGDPHPYQGIKIYPASNKGHIYGFNRITEFANKNFDLIFILNDLWIINEYLKLIKQSFKKIPKIVTYMPIDSILPDESWFSNFDIVDKACVYTNFGHNAVKEIRPDLDFTIIPHGVDTKVFYKINKPKEEIKASIFNNNHRFAYNSFIILNANRNQPRKRIDISFEGFAIFAKDKPNVFYYHHAGIEDVGWNIIRLANKLSKKYGYNVEERLILTNKEIGVQKVPDEKLNMIYNATDVGINCSIGEGWGLTNVEHAVTGAPQIVPDHSACKELFEDCGILIPTCMDFCLEKTITFGKLVHPEAVAEKLNFIYNNKELYNELSEKGIKKFIAPEYNWKNIGNRWHKIFMDLV